MSGNAQANLKLNFETSHILLVEQSQHSLEVLMQIFMGFGARQCHRAQTVKDAQDLAKRYPIQLVVIDPVLRGEDGLEFVRWLRRLETEVRASPVIAISASATKTAILRARNAGASFFVAKPLTPAVLMQRITAVLRDERGFVVAGDYVGPDRRFKFEGPPAEGPRRATDLDGALSDATEPNMSQDEIDSLLKPQKVML